MNGRDALPSVSVVMPARDEAADMKEAAEAVLGQEYAGPLELVIAVAPSADGTDEIARALAAADPRVLVVPNPSGSASAGLNAAVKAASGEVIARVDGHSELPQGYLQRAVELLEATGADNVGGVQAAEGVSWFQRAVAAAMTSRFGVGDARFHRGGSPGATDTVYLGVFRRSTLEALGGYDEGLLRNQDYELNWRIREAGGLVYFSPDLRVRYRPRANPRSLARQYFQYGRWKRVVVGMHPRSLRWRQLVPPAATVALAVGVAGGLLVERIFFAVPTVYLLTVAVASAAAAPRTGTPAIWLPVVFPVMHLSWGLGFVLGMPARRRPRSG